MALVRIMTDMAVVLLLIILSLRLDPRTNVPACIIWGGTNT